MRVAAYGFESIFRSILTWKSEEKKKTRGIASLRRLGFMMKYEKIIKKAPNINSNNKSSPIFHPHISIFATIMYI